MSNTFGVIPVNDLQIVISYLKNRDVSLKVFLKSVISLVNFLVDFVPEMASGEFKAQSHQPLSDAKLVEILETLDGFNAASVDSQSLPVWLIPVLLKLLDIAQMFLRG